MVNRKWRGIGEIGAQRTGPASGVCGVRRRAALRRGRLHGGGEPACISGLIMQGQKKPHECPAFGKQCTPEKPLGAPMVSNEGACAAYYRYRRAETGDAGKV